MEAAHVDPDEDARRSRTTATTGRARSRPAASSSAARRSSPWLNRTTTPPKPMISPTSRLSVIASSARASEAMTIVNSGVVAWRIAASDESMYCSPQVMRLNGMTMLTQGHEHELAVGRPGRAGAAPGRCSSAAPRTSDAEEQPTGDQGERRQRLDPDLDEQVAAAPEERDEPEQDPVAGRRSGTPWRAS